MRHHPRLNRGLSFDDVLLVPQFSDITSRKSEVDLSVDLGRGVTVSIPIISSPMDTVTESDMASTMSDIGGMGIIHRYNSVDEQALLVRKSVASTENVVGAAIGVTGDYCERASACIEAGAMLLCVDVAHGHHILMRDALQTLRSKFGDSLHIMAGNVATLDGFNALADWGATSIRVGIGGGSICSTRIQTGHGIPTLQSVMNCAMSDRDAYIIADGGIKNSGDIVKALAAGADSVMLGSLLSGTEEAPGEVMFRGGEKFKAYRGMASIEAQVDWRGHAASIEGVASVVPYKGSVRKVIQDLASGIKSGLSYSGCRGVKEIQNKSLFIEQTSAGATESSTHIMRT